MITQYISPIAKELGDFRATYLERERGKMEYDDRQEKHAKQQSDKINIMIGIAGVLLTLCIALIALLTYEHETKHTLLNEHGEVYSASSTMQNATK